MTFSRDIYDVNMLRCWLLALTEQVARRLRRNRIRARSVYIKVRFADFRTFVRSQTLGDATSITQEIWRTAIQLLSTRLPEPLPPVRLLGVGVNGIENSKLEQAQFFDEESRVNQTKVDAVMDAVNDRYGSTTLCWALAQNRTRLDENV